MRFWILESLALGGDWWVLVVDLLDLGVEFVECEVEEIGDGLLGVRCCCCCSMKKSGL